MSMRRLLSLFVPSMRVVRLSVYLTCVFTVLSILAGRSLHAQVKEAARALGREIAGLAEITEGAYVVQLNGARVNHARVTTDQSITEVLDRIEAHCNESPGIIAQAWDEMVAKHAAALERHSPPAAFRRGALRENDDEEGMVLCFTDERAFGLSEFTKALERFSETSDLSEFGRVRFAYAKRASDGKTRVVMLWADEGLSLTKMFPASGDADGSDSPLLPRPPESRRTLTGAVVGLPYGVRLYESRQDPQAMQAFYDGWMKQNGWRLAARAERERTTAYLAPNGYQAFLSLYEADGRTYVTLTEAGRVDAPPIASVVVSD